MKGYNAVGERKYKLELVKQILLSAFNKGLNISRKKLISILAVEHGISVAKSKEYLEILKDYMGFRENGDVISE